MTSLQDHEKNFERNPTGTILKWGMSLMCIVFILGMFGWFLGWFGEAAAVAKEEFGPREALRKYEWCKDAAAQLDKKRADIKVYEGRIATMREDYGDTPKKDWPRDEREAMNQMQAELVGVKASYNGLAADYNANMAKFNWQFAEVGTLPKGASEPLPREFKPYEEK